MNKFSKVRGDSSGKKLPRRRKGATNT